MVNSKEYIICDEWLKSIFGYEVYRVAVDDSLASGDGKEMIEDIQRCNPVFIYAKTPVNALNQVLFLEDIGFRLVDTNILFDKAVSENHVFKGNCTVRFEEPSDKSQVVSLANESFEFSRFHLDPFVSNDLANKVKGQWAGNFFTGDRGDRMIVATINKKVVGFLQILFDKNSNLVIDLIAVDLNVRNKGIATDMIKYAEINCSDRERILVGTQIANAASMKLYEKCGFMIAKASYIFHYHNKG